MTDDNMILSRSMQMGDRVVVEAEGMEPFEARVKVCAGWSLVHGVMDWEMERDNGETFLYAIHIDAPIQRVSPIGEVTNERKMST